MTYSITNKYRITFCEGKLMSSLMYSHFKACGNSPELHDSIKLTGRNNSDLMERPLADWTVSVFSSEFRAFPGTHSVNAADRLRFNDTSIPSLSP